MDLLDVMYVCHEFIRLICVFVPLLQEKLLVKFPELKQDPRSAVLKSFKTLRFVGLNFFNC